MTMLITFAKTLAVYRTGILAYCDYFISLERLKTPTIKPTAILWLLR